MTARSIFILFSLSLGFANADTACKGPTPPVPVIIDDIKVDVTAACTTITAITQNGIAQLVCVTAEDALALADLIGHQASVAGKTKCVSAQGRTLCATPDQMAAAIRVLSARRTYPDGGQP